MEIEFDPAKDKANLAKHGVSLSLGAMMDMSEALIERSDRGGEERYVAIGPIDGRAHVMAFTHRAGRFRVISLRRANRREQRRNDAALKSRRDDDDSV